MSASADTGEGDLRQVVEELVRSVDCIVGEPAQRDTAGAKRHLEQAQRILGSRSGSRSGEDASRRDPGRGDSETRQTSGRADERRPGSSREDDSRSSSGRDDVRQSQGRDSGESRSASPSRPGSSPGSSPSSNPSNPSQKRSGDDDTTDDLHRAMR